MIPRKCIRLIEKAKQWPASFSASTRGGRWRLRGANPDIYREFALFSETLVREMGLTVENSDSLSVVLNHLRAAGNHVQTSEHLKTYSFVTVSAPRGRATKSSGARRAHTARIIPLGEALIEFVNSPTTQLPQHRPKKSARTQKNGQAEAAARNRSIKTRWQIIEALQRLRIPQDRWPNFVKQFYQSARGWTESISPCTPPPFQPPDFDPLKESREEWSKRADAAWHRHRDGFLGEQQLWVDTGVEDVIAPPKNTRGAGLKARNARTCDRYEWAAARLSGSQWKNIAESPVAADQVRKSASTVLRLANWPTKLQAQKTESSIPLTRNLPTR
jgi:hypothetical protein